MITRVNKDLMVSRSNSEPLLLDHAQVESGFHDYVVKGKRRYKRPIATQIALFACHEPAYGGACIIAARNMAINLYGYTRKKRDNYHEIGNEDLPENRIRVRVLFPGVVFIHQHGVTTGNHVYFLTDHTGQAMVGNNMTSDGSLCLGNCCQPFTFEPLDLVSRARPNADYAWRGQPLAYDPNTKIITKWPTYKKVRTTPSLHKVAEYFDQLSPT